jgi:hypothetical protein
MRDAISQAALRRSDTGIDTGNLLPALVLRESGSLLLHIDSKCPNEYFRRRTGKLCRPHRRNNGIRPDYQERQGD